MGLKRIDAWAARRTEEARARSEGRQKNRADRWAEQFIQKVDARCASGKHLWGADRQYVVKSEAPDVPYYHRRCMLCGRTEWRAPGGAVLGKDFWEDVRTGRRSLR